jgi:hypothetical protein
LLSQLSPDDLNTRNGMDFPSTPSTPLAPPWRCSADLPEGFEFPDRPPWHVISSRELADVLDVSLQTLGNWRMSGTGPPVEWRLTYPGPKWFYRIDRTKTWLAAKQGRLLEAWRLAGDHLVSLGMIERTECEDQVWTAVDACEAVGVFDHKWPPRHPRSLSFRIVTA